jgi:histidine ammonia-lyase
VLDNLEYILAIELMTACQAIEFRRPLKSSAVLEAAHDFVREAVSFAEEDRVFANDIQKIKTLIADFSFVQRVHAFAAAQGIPLPHAV